MGTALDVVRFPDMGPLKENMSWKRQNIHIRTLCALNVFLFLSLLHSGNMEMVMPIRKLPDNNMKGVRLRQNPWYGAL